MGNNMRSIYSHGVKNFKAVLLNEQKIFNVAFGLFDL